MNKNENNENMEVVETVEVVETPTNVIIDDKEKIQPLLQMSENTESLVESAVLNQNNLEKVEAIVNTLDITNIDEVRKLKNETISNIGDNADKILSVTQTGKINDISELFTSAKAELKDLNEKPKGLFGIIKRKAEVIANEQMTKLNNVSVNLSQLHDHFKRGQMEIDSENLILQDVASKNIETQQELAIATRSIEEALKREIKENYQDKYNVAKNSNEIMIQNDFQKYQNSLISAYKELTNINLTRLDLGTLQPQYDMTIHTNKVVIATIDDFFSNKFPTLKQKIALIIAQQKTNKLIEDIDTLEKFNKEITLSVAKQSSDNLVHAYEQLFSQGKDVETYAQAAKMITEAVVIIDQMVQNQVKELSETNNKASEVQKELQSVSVTKKIDQELL